VALELLQRGARVCPTYDPAYLTEAKLSALTAQCQAEGCWPPIIAYVTGALSSLDLLVKSFSKHLRGSSPAQSVPQKNGNEPSSSDAPPNVDGAADALSRAAPAAPAVAPLPRPEDGGPSADYGRVDYASARRALVATFALEENAFHSDVTQSLVNLSQ